MSAYFSGMRSSLIIVLIALGTLRCSSQQPVGIAPPALIAYYAGNGDGLEEYRVEQLTHLIWCFGHLEGDSLVVAPGNAFEASTSGKVIKAMVGFKKRNPELKVLLSFGGWGGCASCSEVFSRAEGRAAFAASALGLVQHLNVDGIDIDWEYPAVAGPPGHAYADADRHNFTLLVQELRRMFGSRYEISFAVGGPDECILKGFEWDSVMPLVDRVHIMSYDLVHGYSKTTGHHTPLRSSQGQALSAESAVRLLDSLKVPRAKVVIGAAFYARVWKDVPPENNGLFQVGVFKGTIPCSTMDTTITVDKGWTSFVDTDAEAFYAYNAKTHEFLTSDDARSVAAKARYVNAEGLGGVMFWQLVDDSKHDGLLDVMYRALRSK